MKLSTEFKVGLLVILAIGLAYWGINFMQGNDVFKKERSYYAVYEKVNGLVVSNPVSVSGYNVGLVKNISFLDSRGKQILVEFAIKNKNIVIPVDSKVRIFSSDLLGSKAIDIIVGESEMIAEPGDTLQSELEQDLAEAVNAQIAPLKNKAEELLSKISSAVETVDKVFDEGAGEDLNASFKKIKESFESFSELSSNLNVLVADNKTAIDSIINSINNIAYNVSQNEESLDRFFKNMAAISDSVNNANLGQAMTNAAQSLDELNVMIAHVNAGKGTMGKLMYNDSLYNSLVATSTQLDSLLNDMQAHPKRYLSFSVFGKKDKQVKLSKKDIENIKQALKED